MSDTLLVSTRKGLFTVLRKRGAWAISAVDFLGDNISVTLADERDGRRYAALDHGHFGVKLHRSTATGWEEIAAPAYPPKPEGYEETDMWGRPLDWSTARIWALESGGADEPGVIWCGTLPGGLFRSSDHGHSWEMMRALWDHPKRKQWSGGGADLPGLHSICVDPRNSQRVWVAVSTGGIFGSLSTAARVGHNAVKVCAPNTHRRSRPTTRLLRMSTGWCNVRQRHSACGCNTITVFSSRPTKDGRSRRSPTSNPQVSDLRSSYTHESPTRHGLSLRSRMKNASHARGNW